MKVKSKKRVSLYLEWFLLLYLSGMISLLFFAGSRFVIEQQIDKYNKDPNLVQKYNEKYISRLQQYIKEQNISSKDLQKLDECAQTNLYRNKKGKGWGNSGLYRRSDRQNNFMKSLSHIFQNLLCKFVNIFRDALL